MTLPVRALLLVVVIVAVGGRAHADELLPPVVLAKGTGAHSVIGKVQLLEDRERRLTIDAISGDAARSPRWVTSTREGPNFGFTSSVYWARLRLHNPSAERLESVLWFQYTLLDHIDVYVEQPDGRLRHHALGDRLPFGVRAIPHGQLAVPLTTEPGQLQRIFVRVQTDSSMQPGMFVETMHEYIGTATRDQLLHGLYYGIMLVMALYNLFLYIAIRNRSYLLYVIFVATFSCTQLSLDGTSTRYFFPDWPAAANLFTPLSVALSQPWPILFTQHFLDTKQNLPRAHRWLNGYVVASFLLVALVLATPYPIAIRASAAFAMVTSLLCLVLGLMILRLRYRPARFYVLAWIFLILGTILFILVSFGALPANIVTINVQRIGSAFEVALLSFALGDRIKLIEEEREHAKAEAYSLERDMALTAAAQRLFLPRRDTLSSDGVELAGFYRPATQCGGDWWWYEPGADGRMLVLVGDVTGHGPGAAMLTAAIAAAYRSVSPAERARGVPALLHSLDGTFRDISDGKHQMSLVAVEIDVAHGHVRLWSAGAPALFVLRADGEAVPLAVAGTPIGDRVLQIGETACDVAPGDRLFIFSDGLPELVKANGRQLGYRGVQRLLEETRGLDPAAARGQLARAIDHSRGGEAQHDDVTFVVIDIRARPGLIRQAS